MGWEPFKIHEALQNASLLQWLLPIAIHIDGADLFRNREWYFWTWSVPLAAHGIDTFRVKFPILGVRHECVADEETKAMMFWEVARYIGHEIKTLQGRRTHTKDFYGMDTREVDDWLAGGFGGCLFAI